MSTQVIPHTLSKTRVRSSGYKMRYQDADRAFTLNTDSEGEYTYKHTHTHTVHTNRETACIRGKFRQHMQDHTLRGKQTGDVNNAQRERGREREPEGKASHMVKLHKNNWRKIEI